MRIYDGAEMQLFVLDGRPCCIWKIEGAMTRSASSRCQKRDAKITVIIPQIWQKQLEFWQEETGVRPVYEFLTREPEMNLY